MPLAEKIAQEFGTTLGRVELSRFSDGEFQPCFEETVRGKHVYLVCSTTPPADNLMELLLMIDCAKRASASKIIAVMPYFGWARQDRKDKPRVPIGAKMVAKMLETAGATRIVTMDLHADQIQGFFEIPVDHLYASSIFVEYIKQLQKDGSIQNLAIASPDMGGSKRAYSYAKYFGSDVVICYKQRKKANVIESMTLIGDVEGKGCHPAGRHGRHGRYADQSLRHHGRSRCTQRPGHGNPSHPFGQRLPAHRRVQDHRTDYYRQHCVKKFVGQNKSAILRPAYGRGYSDDRRQRLDQRKLRVLNEENILLSTKYTNFYEVNYT